MRSRATKTSLRAPALVGGSSCRASIETSSSFPKVPEQKEQFGSFWATWRILPQLPAALGCVVPPAIPL